MEKLGELAARIYENGHQAARIRSERGISEAEFRRLIAQVSTGPGKSYRYGNALVQKARAGDLNGTCVCCRTETLAAAGGQSPRDGQKV